MEVIRRSENTQKHEDDYPFDAVMRQILKREYPRKPLISLLNNYNKSIGNDQFALSNIERLEKDVCVVTGQQLGFMGGPLYTILKGISCLLLAREKGAVPIYWLATEDHDIAEIDHTYLIDSRGNLQRFHLNLPKEGKAAENLELSSENIEKIIQFIESAGLSPHELPSISTSYAESMAKMMVHLFAGTGMVFVEPKILRTLSADFYSREVQAAEHIQQILTSEAHELQSHQNETVLSFEVGTNLFLKVEGKRCRLHREGNRFFAGPKTFSMDELLKLIKEGPQQFSTNVASRPLLQSSLFPTLAYVAGPTEQKYYRQLDAYHRFHNVPMPVIIPRLSATIVPVFAESLLESCGLKPWDEIPLDAPGYSLHVLRNLLHPHKKLQERVLNWWGFQGQSKENLVQECLKMLSWNERDPVYLYI